MPNQNHIGNAWLVLSLLLNALLKIHIPDIDVMPVRVRGDDPLVAGPTLEVVYFSWMNNYFCYFHFRLHFLGVDPSDTNICVLIRFAPSILQGKARLSDVNLSYRKQGGLPKPFLAPKDTHFVCPSSKEDFLTKTSLITL